MDCQLLCPPRKRIFNMKLNVEIDLSTAVNQVESVAFILRRLGGNADNEFQQLFLEAQRVASNLDSTMSIPKLMKHQTKR